jgi:RNA-directed DNA polymerase
MSAEGGEVNTGELPAQEGASLPAAVRAAIVAGKPGNAGGAKGGRKEETGKEGSAEENSPPVPATDKQGEEDLWQRYGAERAVWSDRMLMALEKGVKGNVWFSLIDKVYGERTLVLAWEKVRNNAGACGVDRMSVAHFGKDSQRRLLAVKEHLKEGRYKPRPVRRVMIPKPGSTEKRPLGIPTVTDRVVQTALRLVMEPVFEREFAAQSYGFRPGRGCKDALRRVEGLLQGGLTHVVDVDIRGYFDSIPHEKLMKLVGKRIADGRVLELVEKFLKAGVMGELGEVEETAEGTPQGGTISPLLANIYLDPLDHLMSRKGWQMVRYADDMVILCKDGKSAEAALEEVRKWMAEAGLELHPEKTRKVDMGQPGAHFDFLGYRFWRSRQSGKLVRLIRPKSRKNVRAELKPLLRRTNGESLEAITGRLRPRLRGIYEYFKHASGSSLLELDGWVRGRLRSILRKRHGGQGRGKGLDHYRWPNRYFANHGLFSLEEARELELISLRKAVNL